MNETREVLGVWAWEGLHKARSKKHESARWEFMTRHFGGEQYVPKFIWRVEFFKVTDHYHGDDVRYGMTLHRYAQDAEGKRHRTWVKVYDYNGQPANHQLVATVAPENHELPYRAGGTLPPEWLLKNWPEVKSD